MIVCCQKKCCNFYPFTTWH